jgi:hypothetical protein
LEAHDYRELTLSVVGVLVFLLSYLIKRRMVWDLMEMVEAEEKKEARNHG